MTRRLTAVVTIVVGLLASAQVRAADAIDFATQIQPIFAANCTGCHGADKQSGKLRLDSAEEIGKFAKETLLVAGKPDDSELVKRISLPADNPKRMPKMADPLPAETIELIRQWVSEGAKLTAGDEAPKPNEEAPPHEPAPRGEDDPELAALAPAPEEAIAKIEGAGGSVLPLFGGSPLLQVSFAHAASPPGDEALAALEAAAEQIVWLNLSKVQASADGLARLAKLKNLIQLHLEHSTINDAGLAHLAGLSRLEYLNFYGADVTDAGLEPLKGLKKLRNLYVWQTKVSYDAAQALQKEIPGLEVNLGWDHPQVVRIRVTKEVETAKEIAKTAAARAGELESQFNAAKEAKDQAESRVKELEDQLKALDAPAEAEDKQAEGEGDEQPAEESEEKEEKSDDAEEAKDAEAEADDDKEEEAKEADAKEADEEASDKDSDEEEAKEEQPAAN